MADVCLGDGTGTQVTDNIGKRGGIIGRLLTRATWVDQQVLEIGIGSGVTATALKVSVLGSWTYTGTDMAVGFVRHARDVLEFNVARAEVTNLPGADGEFSRIIALDSLEHVHPDDRAEGYAEMARVCAPAGLLLINMPLMEDHYSQHNPEFDHRFGLDDLHQLELAGFVLLSYEFYLTENEPPRPLAFVVMKRT